MGTKLAGMELVGKRSRSFSEVSELAEKVADDQEERLGYAIKRALGGLREAESVVEGSCWSETSSVVGGRR